MSNCPSICMCDECLRQQGADPDDFPWRNLPVSESPAPPQQGIASEAVERVERYIAEYEDAPNWGGPTMYPAPPKIADLRAILAMRQVEVPGTVGVLTSEFEAMNGRDKWETLVLNGLVGTDEPWIAAMTQTLRAEADMLERLTSQGG